MIIVNIYQFTLHTTTSIQGERSYHGGFDISKNGYKAISCSTNYESFKGAIVTSGLDPNSSGYLYLDVFNMKTLSTTDIVLLTKSIVVYIKLDII